MDNKFPWTMDKPIEELPEPFYEMTTAERYLFTRLKKAESERDAARAQLEVARDALEYISRHGGYPEDIKEATEALAKMKEMEG